MKPIEKLNFLESEVAASTSVLTKKRDASRARAFAIRISTVILSGTITILLGLRLGTKAEAVLGNVALVCGAMITVISAIEAFFDHRSLWIRRTMTMSRLQNLQRRISYYRSGSDNGDLRLEDIDLFLDEFDEILKEYRESWLRIRQGSLASSIGMRDSTQQESSLQA